MNLVSVPYVASGPNVTEGWVATEALRTSGSRSGLASARPMVPPDVLAGVGNFSSGPDFVLPTHLECLKLAHSGCAGQSVNTSVVGG